MPCYRLKTGIVHVKGSRLPAPCSVRISWPSTGKEQVCMAPSAYLCDGPPPPHRQGDHQDTGTCDAPLCEVHAREIGKNRHLCPTCLQSHSDSDPQRGLFTSIV